MILQFKITLSGSDPKIWRRFQVGDSLSFYHLHLIIQNVMGWTNSHLYQFVYEKNNFIGNPEMLESDDIADDKETGLSPIFDKPKVKMIYEYDFGDGWMHELVLEKIVEKKDGQFYPVCLTGEMNCPPEDCGGIYGYYDKLKVLKSKKHPDYRDTVEWMGDYDMKEFDLEAINQNLKDYRGIDMGLN